MPGQVAERGRAPAPANGRGALAPGGRGPRLRHEPALDGLRGLAVAVVVAFHLDHLRGGFLGVDLFFVLSGYLITSLLLVEQRGRGTIDLGRFWSRRARRLLPALFLLLAGIAFLLATLTPTGERPTFRGEALATLGYVANWQAMGDDVGYWDMFTQPSPLDHMWSLAIEEQFYLVWPLLVVGLLAVARRARLLGASVVTVAAAGGALVSFVVLAAEYTPLDTSRAYYGTDARVGPTLLGAALAALAARRGRARVPEPIAVAGVPEPPPAAFGVAEPRPDASGSSDHATAARGAGRSVWLAAGLAALAVMAWSLVATDGTRSWYYRGGLAAFSLAAIVVVHIVTTGRGGPLARGLSVRPLVALGIISYGVYLWHWPVIVYFTPARVGVNGLWLDALCVAVTLALAVGSYLLVERPIRRGALRGRPIRLALAGSVAVTAAAVLVVTNGVARVPGTDVALAGSGNASTVYPAEIPQDASRILLVGDSGVIFLGPALAAEAERHGAVAASDARPFCTVLAPEGTGRIPDGTVTARKPCHDTRRDKWSELVERFDPDVVVYYIAAGGGVGDLLLDGRWVGPCEQTYDAYLLEALTADVDLLAEGGATVVLATTPEAPFISADPPAVHRALACRRTTMDGVVAARPATEIVDMAAFILGAQADSEESFYRDPVHLSDLGARQVAAWLVPTTLALA